MPYSINLEKKTYVLTYPDQSEKTLMLVTSIAFYNSSLPSLTDIRWKIEKEDAAFLKSLVNAAIKSPSKTSFDSLIAMEEFYKELLGNPKGDVDENEAANANRRDYMTQGSRTNTVNLDVQNEDYKDPSFIGPDGPAYTIGDLVELNNKAGGVAKNAWRKTKKPKK